MNVATEVEKLFIGFYADCFKSTLKKRTFSFIFRIEIVRITVIETMDEICNSIIH